MTNSSGTIQAEYAFDPYGRTTKISETTPADFQFAGYYLHARSGLNLTLFRAYSAGLGRWISRDPIGERAGINIFGYVRNNPIKFMDSWGLQHVDVPPGLQGTITNTGDEEAPSGEGGPSNDDVGTPQSVPSSPVMIPVPLTRSDLQPVPADYCPIRKGKNGGAPSSDKSKEERDAENAANEALAKSFLRAQDAAEAQQAVQDALGKYRSGGPTLVPR